jgi:hypothetical protein
METTDFAMMSSSLSQCLEIRKQPRNQGRSTILAQLKRGWKPKERLEAALEAQGLIGLRYASGLSPFFFLIRTHSGVK